MANKLNGPAIVFKNAKYPNIPKSFNVDELTADDIKKLAAHMASPVRGSTPSPFVGIDYHDYTSANGQKYRFFLKKVNGSYDITVYSFRQNGSIKKIWRCLHKNIIDADSLPDDFKIYLNKFIKNIAFT
jgi:hypothetical protein